MTGTWDKTRGSWDTPNLLGLLGISPSVPDGQVSQPFQRVLGEKKNSREDESYARARHDHKESGTLGTLGHSLYNPQNPAENGIELCPNQCPKGHDGLGHEVDALALPLPLHEVALLPVRYWVATGPHSLCVALPGFGAPIVLTTSRTRYSGAHSAGEAAFGPRETLVLLAAAELYRVGQLGSWAASKLQYPGWTLTAENALEGAQRPARRPEGLVWWAGAPPIPGAWMDHGWTMGRLVAACGLRMVEVVVETEEAAPAPLAGAEAPQSARGRAA